MVEVSAWAAMAAGASLQRHRVTLPSLGDSQVEVEVTHCGICRSDVHLVDDDWGSSQYPVIPGHEIVGVVRDHGERVMGLAPGTRVGVGWQSDSCQVCPSCIEGHDNLCRRQQRTCVGRSGGFARRVRVDGRFVYPLPEALPSEEAAPLLCAGATVFAPLRRFGISPGARVGVIGLGGLGHLAVQFARQFGAEVTVFTSDPDKGALAKELGASRVVASADRDALKGERNRHDLIVSTVHVELPWSRYVGALAPRGTLCLLGMPPKPISVHAGLLVEGQRNLTGSVVASRSMIRQMLAVAAERRVRPMVETMAMEDAERGLQRVRDGQARFRVVLAAS
ncbi:MAG: NAD(P)-dependent alcohol dehydrogenase [Myxococcota bacterium]